jgi:AraC-like DNA-binding protein
MIPHKPSVELAVLGVAAEPMTIRIAVPSLVVSIESSVAHVRVRGTDVTVDRSSCLVVPGRDVVTMQATGAARVVVLGFHASVLAAVEGEYKQLGFDRARFVRWLKRSAELPRTVWLHELVHRYVFERHALGETDNLAIRFLEIEIAKEIYFLFRDRESGAERATIVRTHSPQVDRALHHIESHLFDVCNVAALTRVSGASSSTLLRLFRNEVGCSPGAYWRNRKLDEALIALRAGRSVAEVATRIGYENPTAFGFAFRRRFGRSPSAFRPTGRIRAAP